LSSSPPEESMGLQAAVTARPPVTSRTAARRRSVEALIADASDLSGGNNVVAWKIRVNRYVCEHGVPSGGQVAPGGPAAVASRGPTCPGVRGTLVPGLRTNDPAQATAVTGRWRQRIRTRRGRRQWCFDLRRTGWTVTGV